MPLNQEVAVEEDPPHVLEQGTRSCPAGQNDLLDTVGVAHLRSRVAFLRMYWDILCSLRFHKQRRLEGSVHGVLIVRVSE